MARNVIETCIYCSPAPCNCLATPVKKPRKGLPPKLPAVEQESRPPQVIPAQQLTPIRTALLASQHVRQATEQRDTTEIEERNALTVLVRHMPLVADDIEKVRDKLNMSALEIDTIVWKSKRFSQTGRR